MPIYHKSFVTIAVTIFPHSCSGINKQTTKQTNITLQQIQAIKNNYLTSSIQTEVNDVPVIFL